MRFKKIAITSMVSLALLSSAAHAVLAPPPVASASIDWSTFEMKVIDTNPTDGIDAVATFTIRDRTSDVYASITVPASGSSADWTTFLSASDGVASATAQAGSLSAMFSSPPSALNAYAVSNRYGYFTLSTNTLVTFSVNASASIDMNVPLNGSAYAWASLQTDGPGFDGADAQHSETSKLVFAQGAGSPLTQSGKLNASFYNGSGGNLDGTVHAFAQVNSNGFIAAGVPEPETYALMLAGLGLMVFMARRRIR